jgi:putative flippase GtrA
VPNALVTRVRGIGPELLKFVVVGGFCFVLDFILFNAFHYAAGIGPLTSKSLSTVIATAVSYVGNRLWSFAHRVDEDGSHGEDIARYAAINVVGLVITLIPLGIVYYGISRHQVVVNAAQLFGTAVATVFRFYAYRRWVFKSDPDLAERTALV